MHTLPPQMVEMATEMTDFAPLLAVEDGKAAPSVLSPPSPSLKPTWRNASEVVIVRGGVFTVPKDADMVLSEVLPQLQHESLDVALSAPGLSSNRNWYVYHCGLVMAVLAGMACRLFRLFLSPMQFCCHFFHVTATTFI